MAIKKSGKQLYWLLNRAESGVYVWNFFFIPCFFLATQRPSSFSSNGERQGPQWEEPGLQKWRLSLAQSIWWGHFPAEGERVTTRLSLVSQPHCCDAEMTHLMRQLNYCLCVEVKYYKNVPNKRCFNFKTDTHSLLDVSALQLHSDIKHLPYYRASADVIVTSQLHRVFQK